MKRLTFIIIFIFMISIVSALEIRPNSVVGAGFNNKTLSGSIDQAYTNIQNINDSNFETFVSPIFPRPYTGGFNPVINLGTINFSMPINASTLSLRVGYNASVLGSNSGASTYETSSLCILNQSTSTFYVIGAQSGNSLLSSNGSANITIGSGNIIAYRDIQNNVITLKVNGASTECAGYLTYDTSSKNISYGISEVWLNYVVDNTPPNVSIQIVSNSNLTSSDPARTYSFPVNNSEDVELDSCWYSLNGGTNTTYSCSNGAISSAFVSAIPSGNNNITFYARNDAGAISSSSLSFSYSLIGILFYSYNYSNLTYETANENFILNFSVGDVISVSANLIYNGSARASTVSCSGIYCIARNNFDIPLLNSGNQENRSFYWTVTTFSGNSSLSNSTQAFNQTVNQLTLTQCTSGTIAINFTNWDEQNRTTRISPFDFEASFNYYLGSGLVYKNLNISNTTATEVPLCINYNSTYYIDGIIAYTPPANYPTRNYFYQRYPIDNSQEYKKLYSLLNSYSTSFILQVQDSALLPMKGVLVEAQRCYPGIDSNESVFAHRTDSSGLTVGNLEAETALYQFYITNQSSVLLAVTPCAAVVPQTTPYTLLFQIGGGYVSPFINIENQTDIDSDLTYNATSNTVSWTYIDTSDDFINANLIVYSLNYSGNSQPIFCSSSSNLSAATLSCNVSTAGTYSARVLVYRSGQALVDQLVFAVQTFASTVGYYGVFLAFFLILVSAFAFKWNEIAGIWMINAAVIFVNVVGLVAFGPVFITALLIISVIITAILER